MRNLTTASLFCGIGGFCNAFEQAGFDCLWANEVDEYACITYRHFKPQVRLISKDLRSLSVEGDKLEEVDVLTAGFPCQPFSQAGEMKGFEDPRGDLMFDMLRLIKDFGEKKPKMILFENVSYFKKGNGGAWFLKLQIEMQKLGYWFGDTTSEILNTATHTDIPQNRERLFMVGLRADIFPEARFVFPPKVKRRKGLANFINRRKRQDSTYYLPEDNKYRNLIAENSIESKCINLYQIRRYYVRVPGSVCPTLTANMGKGGHNVPFLFDRWGIRKLTEQECLGLQGFDLNIKIFPEEVPRAKRYQQVGNSVTVPLVRKIAEECKAMLKNKE